ncbi:class I SAM-dependent methyltransferase [Nocardia colli]|uniref:class I SAM-dependent methyltransferase n=1 Tax=Nocardia colli TaxID=2545717 RepID=UPI001CC5F396|nr:class I SAM-dependent methyltransferase [Nocardia colli]
MACHKLSRNRPVGSVAACKGTHGRIRLLVAARSRFAEDALAEAVAARTRQAIILGAGPSAQRISSRPSPRS